jgi:hypothetical protein
LLFGICHPIDLKPQKKLNAGNDTPDRPSLPGCYPQFDDASLARSLDSLTRSTMCWPLSLTTLRLHASFRAVTFAAHFKAMTRRTWHSPSLSKSESVTCGSTGSSNRCRLSLPHWVLFKTAFLPTTPSVTNTHHRNARQPETPELNLYSTHFPDYPHRPLS